MRVPMARAKLMVRSEMPMVIRRDLRIGEQMVIVKCKCVERRSRLRN